MDEESELQRDTVALVKKHGAMLVLAPGLKPLLKRLAVHLDWYDLQAALK